MTRRDFKLGAPYREILSSDSAKPFENELFRECDVLADLVTKNIGNSHVIVYDRNGDVLSFIWFYDNDPYFYIEFVATNRKFRSGLRPSSKLIILLEEIGGS